MKLTKLLLLFIVFTPYVFSQTVLWQDTFDDPTKWVIDGTPTYQGSWVIGVNADVPEATGNMGDMNSTTHTDGFAFFDALQYDINGTPDNQNAWIEMNNSVDLSAHQEVIFSFEQRYKASTDDQTFVEMSTDGGASWGGAIMDPNYNIMASAPATQNTIYQKFAVNGSNQVKFRFRWSCNGTSAYGWMVDDVSIISVADFDLLTKDLLIETDGVAYTQIPLDQVAPINFSLKATNYGKQTQTGVVFTAHESSTGYVGTSTSTTISPDVTDSLFVNQAFTPSALGSYNVTFSTSSDNTDEIPGNNELDDYNFDVTQHIYAVDNNIEGSPLNASNNNASTEGGNLFTIYQDQILTGIDGYFHSDMDDNVSFDVKAKLYKYDNNSIVLVEESVPYTVQPGDAGSFHTFELQSPILLNAGESYFAMVGSQSSELKLAYSTKPAPPQKSFFYDNGSWFYTFLTPMVRMNFDPCALSLNDLDLSITDTYCSGSCDGLIMDNDPNSNLYTYNWYDGNNNLLHTGEEFTDVCEGNYVVTKEDGCGNSDQAIFTVGSNQLISNHSFNNSDASTCSSADGAINLVLDYFVSSYNSNDITIEVDGPTTDVINTTSSINYSIPNVLPGDYTITITDGEYGCDPWEFTTTVDYDGYEQSLCLVSVDSLNTDQNIIVWEKPADISNIDSFFVYREITAGNYEKIGATHIDSLSQFVDTSANPNSTAYRYKISILNVCGDEMMLSPYHNTIHLQFQGNGNFNWNHYQIEGASNVVSSYNFYRDDNSDGNWQLLEVVSGNQSTFTDPDFSLYPDASYFINVNWSNQSQVCQATKAQDYNSSRSNKYSIAADDDDVNSLAGHSNDGVSIYPNPSSSFIRVKSVNNSIDKLTIYSAVGEAVLILNNSFDKVDISSLNPGVYIVDLEMNNKSIRKRIVKK